MSEGYRLDARTMAFGGWAVFFALVTLGTVVFVLVNPVGSMTGAVLSAALVVLLQIVYWALARPRLAGIRTDGWRARAYAVVAIVIFTIAAALNPWAALLLFALTPQIFLVLTPRPATAVIIALNVAPLAVRLAGRSYAPQEVIQDLGTTAFTITFSLFFASRILNISRQNEERRRLILELGDREAEVAALSAARGAEAERSRIAREMHDTLAQGFASIVTLSHAVRGELDRDPAGARRHVELIIATARENLAESRRIIAALGPGRLAAASLGEAVERTVAAWQETTGLSARVQITGMPADTSATTDVVALRLVQECLENVRKHARAREVVIALGIDVDDLTVEVRDDGAGFDPSPATEGFGMAGMRARVAEIGGTLDVSSIPDQGTAIVARLPTRSGS